MNDLMRDIIPMNEAKALREFGFNETCSGYYETSDGSFHFMDANLLENFPYLAMNSEWKDLIGAPTYTQAFRFIRNKYKLNYEHRQWTAEWYTGVIQKIDGIVTYLDYGGINSKYKTPEETDFVYLKKLIEIINQEKFAG